MHIRPCPSLLKRASSPAPRKAMASSAIRRIWAMRSFGFRVSSFKFKYQRSCLKGRAFRRAESSSIFAIPSEVAAATESRDLLFSAVPTGLGLFIIAHQGLRPGLILFRPAGSSRTGLGFVLHLATSLWGDRVESCRFPPFRQKQAKGWGTHFLAGSRTADPSTPAANSGPPPLRMTVGGDCAYDEPPSPTTCH